MTWKKKIKKLLPDKLVYSYNVIRTVPEYLKALKDKFRILNFIRMKKQCH